MRPTYSITIAIKVRTQFTPQLSPLQDLAMPMNLMMTRASQKTGSMQLRIMNALRLFHREKRQVCSVSSWYTMMMIDLTA